MLCNVQEDHILVEKKFKKRKVKISSLIEIIIQKIIISQLFKELLELLSEIYMEIIIISITKIQQQIKVHHNLQNLIILILSPPEINKKVVMLFREE